ncbi:MULTISPECIES: hypothetical protein [Pelosinus]|uniref:Uncharacterized protein n=1 Tax=Pelosinus fermentans B4 TaxID=1149862 RepID=I8RNN2_9FIRM|nr:MULTISPECIES: hypothetical protein [Pelosinus]EIW20715.1 hypothetical protein FB4_1927 [Pelosinus fermentans B4]EIW25440.1 hypothetical protein FA11_2599 [Pelosinus fermentans A11]OAM93700.1 hypothetical protein FR7_01717 [Pelosinus fermentans DSM 17108]SDQ87039.1 hypothetical protein SAMN04515679_1803 [Pelosinus fermentans]
MCAIRFREAKPGTVQTMNASQNEMGELVEVWETTGLVNAEIWPLRGNQSRGKMGVTDKSTHELFTADAVKSNTRVIQGLYNGYLVGHVEDWDTHRTAILEKVF